MEGQYKKIFSIMGALIAGIVIIFFAVKSGSMSGLSLPKSGGNDKGTLTSLPSADTGSKKMLGIWSGIAEPRDLSTTTTDALVYDLINNYTNATKSTGAALTDAEITAQAQALAQKTQLPTGKQYKITDLNISMDNSPAARAEYAKAAGALIQTFITSQTKGDLVIVFASPDTMDDSTKGAELSQNISHYEKLVMGLLALKTPSSISKLHLGLIQAYSGMKNSVNLMLETFNDPVKGLAAFTQYRNAVESLTIVTAEYKNVVSKNK